MKSVQFFVTRNYERAVPKLMPDNARVEMEAAVVTDPENATT